MIFEESEKEKPVIPTSPPPVEKSESTTALSLNVEQKVEESKPQPKETVETEEPKKEEPQPVEPKETPVSTPKQEEKVETPEPKKEETKPAETSKEPPKEVKVMDRMFSLLNNYRLIQRNSNNLHKRNCRFKKKWNLHKKDYQILKNKQPF